MLQRSWLASCVCVQGLRTAALLKTRRVSRVLGPLAGPYTPVKGPSSVECISETHQHTSSGDAQPFNSARLLGPLSKHR